MGSQQKPSAKRRSFRCAVPAAQEETILEAGGWRYRVRLLNESVEGAAVSADQDMGIKAGDQVRLSTAFGRFVARVVHIAKLDPTGAGESPETPGFRLGLEWLREPPPPAWQPPPPDPARSPAPSSPGEN